MGVLIFGEFNFFYSSDQSFFIRSHTDGGMSGGAHGTVRPRSPTRNVVSERILAATAAVEAEMKTSASISVKAGLSVTGRWDLCVPRAEVASARRERGARAPAAHLVARPAA